MQTMQEQYKKDPQPEMRAAVEEKLEQLQRLQRQLETAMELVRATQKSEDNCNTMLAQTAK